MTVSKRSDDRTYDGWLGRHADDADGDEIGEIDHIFSTSARSGRRRPPRPLAVIQTK
jgi:hypothetical protein